MKKIVKKVVSIVRIFDKSGKYLRIERLLFEVGSLISCAENLAKFDVLRNSY